MAIPDRIMIEALEALKAKAVAKAQHKPFDRHPNPLLCPCDECRKAYKPMALDSRHFVIDSTYREKY